MSTTHTNNEEAIARSLFELLHRKEKSLPQFAWDFDHEQRLQWHFNFSPRNGVPMRHLEEQERRNVHKLVAAILSSKGYEKFNNTLVMESVLGDYENNHIKRDPLNYFLSLFGQIQDHDPWAFSLEGHHFSINYTHVNGHTPTLTPLFYGAYPTPVSTGKHAGWRSLAQEEDLALAFYSSLTDKQRKVATLGNTPPHEIVTRNDKRVSLKHFEGLAGAAMNDDQKRMLVTLIEQYISDGRKDIYHATRSRLMKAGLEAVYFCWAGGSTETSRYYYRIHGPTILIEFDKSRDDANHVHTVWRDPQLDFGYDLLHQHYNSPVSSHKH